MWGSVHKHVEKHAVYYSDVRFVFNLNNKGWLESFKEPIIVLKTNAKCQKCPLIKLKSLKEEVLSDTNITLMQL